MRMSDIPGYQVNIEVPSPKIEGKTLNSLNFKKLSERINYIQNTTMKFNLNKNTLTTDTRELSKNILITVSRTNIPMIKPGEIPDSDFISRTEKNLNQGIKKWIEQERTTFISAFINRTIDQTCRENHAKIGSDAKKNLFNEIHNEYFKNEKLDCRCANSSILQTILNDNDLNKKIININIDSAIPDEIENIMLMKMDEIINNIKNQKSDIEVIQNKQKELASFQGSYKTALLTERMSVRSDIYNSISENIFNTLLCDKFYGENSGAVKFDEVREEIKNRVLLKSTPITNTPRFFFSDAHLSVTTEAPDDSNNK